MPGERFGVSSSTVQNVLRVLKQEGQEGQVYSQLGRGSFVSSTVSGTDAPDASADEDGEEAYPDWPIDLIRNDDGRLPYVQVTDYLRRDITEGTYSRLPPVREIQERFQVANSTAQNAYRSLKQEGLVYSVKDRAIFVRQAPEPGKRHGPITNYLLREEIAREARAAAAAFADLTDDELLAREAELD